jgi:hypothetical protein
MMAPPSWLAFASQDAGTPLVPTVAAVLESTKLDPALTGIGAQSCIAASDSSSTTIALF